ncbi:MAG: peptidoglycan DD-metalloendopeptidase family protein [Rhodoglobus sp.]
MSLKNGTDTVEACSGREESRASQLTLRSRAFRVIAFATVFAFVLGGALRTNIGQASAVADYPTWSDVTEARNGEAATKALVDRIKSALVQLESKAAAAQKDAEDKGNIWQEADNEYQAKAAQTASLQEQADAARSEADEAEKRIGELAARLVRVGGGDVTLNLLVNSRIADSLLYNLGMSSKISQQTSALFDRAVQVRNTAQSLSDAAEVARTELERLKLAAEEAFVKAQTSSAAATAALEEQEERKVELDSQLAALTEERKVTEESYLAGVRQREAERAAAAAAAAAASNLNAGAISSSGWAKPSGGYITSIYGFSSQYGARFHKGVDLGANCGTNMYAASSGTVVYAAYGWNGGYGNYIIIEHASGLRTAYGHIEAGGIAVSYGQKVAAGSKIARVGTTGSSTGCHLHFEVRPGGWDTTDPVPFMADRGIRLG